MRSMTGYGEASGDNGRYGVTVSLKAVNHRFFDLALRIGDELRASESALRDLLGREISRGRVEARVEVRSVAERRASVHVHMGVVREAHAAVHQLVEAGLVEHGLSAGDLLRVPEAFRVELSGGGVGARGSGASTGSRPRRGDAARGRPRARRGQPGRHPGRAHPRPGRSRRHARRPARPGARRACAPPCAAGSPSCSPATPLDEARIAQEVALLVDRERRQRGDRPPALAPRPLPLAAARDADPRASASTSSPRRSSASSTPWAPSAATPR